MSQTPKKSDSIDIMKLRSKKNDENDDVFQTPPAQNFLSEQYKNKDDEDSTPENLDDIILLKEDIFVNLTLIAKIEAGDKLVRNKTDKHLNIDTSYLQFITRWFKGVGRNNSLKFINLILTKAFEINDKLIEDKNEVDAQTLFRLTSDLKNSLNGLNNLKQTYSYDKLIQSEIDVMIDNIRSKLDYNSKNLVFSISKK